MLLFMDKLLFVVCLYYMAGWVLSFDREFLRCEKGLKNLGSFVSERTSIFCSELMVDILVPGLDPWITGLYFEVEIRLLCFR